MISSAQCDQIRRFLQVLGNKLSHKRSPNILVIFWAISNYVIIVATFWTLRGDFRQLFIPSSGHTGHTYASHLFVVNSLKNLEPPIS